METLPARLREAADLLDDPAAAAATRAAADRIEAANARVEAAHARLAAIVPCPVVGPRKLSCILTAEHDGFHRDAPWSLGPRVWDGEL